MNKNIKIIIEIFVGILFVLGMSYILLSQPKPIKNDYYTIEPEPWIEETPFDNNDDNVIINVNKATRSESKFEINKQELYKDGLKTLFSNGIYKGNPFEQAYLDPAFVNDSDNLDKYILIKIGPELNPNDGIIEGFILGKYEGEEFVFYMFVDQDWRDNLEYTNIVYGNNIKNANIRQFDYSKVVNGIYIDKITGDFNWFETSPRIGGVYLGEIDLNTIDNNNIINKTFIYVR
jgi:hypothetical protein